MDEDDSIVSDDMSDMGEECDLRAAAMPDVSHSAGVAVQQESPSQKGAGTAQRHVGVFV